MPRAQHGIQAEQERVLGQAAGGELFSQPGEHLITFGVGGADAAYRLSIRRRRGFGRGTTHDMEYRDQGSRAQESTLRALSGRFRGPADAAVSRQGVCCAAHPAWARAAAC